MFSGQRTMCISVRDLIPRSSPVDASVYVSAMGIKSPKKLVALSICY